VPRTWFLDFDDTLATGATTWGLKYALPRLMQDHQLTCERQVYQQAVLAAQEQSNQERDSQLVLDELFDKLGWPRSLQSVLLNDIFTNYRAQLFEDTLPFLERLKTRAEPVYILSNNPTAADLVQYLGIADYFRQVYTPESCPNTRPKPHRSLWDYVLKTNPAVGAGAVMVGDDPWSDGAFARKCGLPCWLVDREKRFEHLRGQDGFGLVSSLLDIPLDDPV
jgi:FMN phosphatase YigB (HAD superfamily)